MTAESIEIERANWNRYNGEHRRIDDAPDEIAADEVSTLVRWLAGRSGIDILDVGCGSGWLTGLLEEHGHVVGTDLADEPLETARARYPQAEFIAGDFADIDFGDRKFDVIISVEVLSHVEDQSAFMAKVAKLLKPGGELLIATQNRPILERNSSVIRPPPAGHRRHWVNRAEMRGLLSGRFEILEFTTLTPRGRDGVLKFVNSTKATRLAGMMLGRNNVKRLKESFGLGWTIMVRARRRAVV